jgi:hypothetical protein
MFSLCPATKSSAIDSPLMEQSPITNLTYLTEIKTVDGQIKTNLKIHSTNKLPLVYTPIVGFTNPDKTLNTDFIWVDYGKTAGYSLCYFISNISEPIEIQTWVGDVLETTKKANFGDMIVIGISGEMYVVSRSRIHDLYNFYGFFGFFNKAIPENPSKEDLKNRKLIVSPEPRYVCRYLGQTIKIIPTWGGFMELNNKDYLVIETKDGNIVGHYRVAEALYKITYKPIP